MNVNYLTDCHNKDACAMQTFPELHILELAINGFSVSRKGIIISFLIKKLEAYRNGRKNPNSDFDSKI